MTTSRQIAAPVRVQGGKAGPPFLAKVAIVAVLFALFLGGFFWGKANVKPVRPAAVLSIDERDLKFGPVQSQRRFQWQVTLHNTSEYAVAVNDIRASCNCSKISPSKFVIPVGGSQKISFEIDTTHRTVTDTSESPRPFAVFFQPILAGAVPFFDSYKLDGRVYDPFNSEPSAITYGGSEALVAGEAGTPKQVKVQLLDSKNARNGSLRASCDPNGGVVTAPRQGSDSSTWVFTFTPTAQTMIGRFEHEILLKKCDVNGTELFRGTIPVTGQVISPLQVYPAVIAIAPTENGVATGSCVLALRGIKTIGEAPQIACDDPRFEVVIDPREYPSHEASFHFLASSQPSSGGAASLSVSVMSTDGDEYSHTIPIHWPYVGRK